VIEGLGRDRRLLLVDLLGHGGSDAPGPLRHEVERQAADIAWLIDGLADGHADVVGYSFGARVALRLALDTPGVVRRLVLESPSAGLADPQAREARVAADASRATLPDEVRAAIREEHLAASARGLAGSLRGAGQGAMEPLQGRLSSMIAATLVVAGDLDPTGTQRAAEVARGIPQARLELVPDAGHAPHLEQPATFVRICNDFFAHSSQGAP
jgi:pimeloyl-ACP methyl ester carboxylesterase